MQQFPPGRRLAVAHPDDGAAFVLSDAGIDGRSAASSGRRTVTRVGELELAAEERRAHVGRAPAARAAPWHDQPREVASRADKTRDT